MDTQTVRESLNKQTNKQTNKQEYQQTEQQVNLLFVYGTLLGESGTDASQYLYRHSRTIAYGFFLGKLFQLDGYPGAVYGLGKPDTYPVCGAIMELDQPESVLPELDKYEETGPSFPQPHEFIRVLIPIHSDIAGQILDCWAYLYNLDTSASTEIPGGRYIHMIRQRNGVS